MNRRRIVFCAAGAAVIVLAGVSGLLTGQKTERAPSGVVSLGRPAMVETWGCDSMNSHLVYDVTVHVAQDGAHLLTRVFHLATAGGVDTPTQQWLNIPLDDGRVLLVGNRWPNVFPPPPFEWHPFDVLQSREVAPYILDRSTNPPEVILQGPEEFSVRTEVSDGVWSCAKDFPMDPDQMIDPGGYGYGLETRRNFGRKLMVKFVFPERTERGFVMVFKGAEHLMP